MLASWTSLGFTEDYFDCVAMLIRISPRYRMVHRHCQQSDIVYFFMWRDLQRESHPNGAKRTVKIFVPFEHREAAVPCTRLTCRVRPAGGVGASSGHQAAELSHLLSLYREVEPALLSVRGGQHKGQAGAVQPPLAHMYVPLRTPMHPSAPLSTPLSPTERLQRLDRSKIKIHFEIQSIYPVRVNQKLSVSVINDSTRKEILILQLMNFVSEPNRIVADCYSTS